MRELQAKEVKVVCGGNPIAGALVSLGGAYYFGTQVGTDIYKSITSSYGMSPGEAAYYTFGK